MVKRREICVGKDVHVVYEHGGGWVEVGGGMPECSSGVEKEIALIADADVEAEMVVGGKVVDNLLAEVVDVDDDALEASLLQSQYDMVEQGPSGHRHEGLGHRVGERAQACSETCGEEHGLFHGTKVRRIVRRIKILV